MLQKAEQGFCPVTSSVSLVMNDKSFQVFTMKNYETAGNRSFYTASDDVENTPPAVKYKFQQRLLVWVAISVRGHSQPYFCPSEESGNGEIYCKECVTARLVPFLDENHSDGDYLSKFLASVGISALCTRQSVCFRSETSSLCQRAPTQRTPLS